ncbi:MFS transporter [Streptomyces sp900105245]|uniref:MFS transporter n=1 Tax=Streptomyces sp. 900105245 TaxID=3154379 RepID=UPI00332539AF
MLGQRHCARLLVASVAGRLPLGMVPVALILAARSDGHSLATASMLAALYGVAPAVGLPLLGRLADVRGLPLPCHLGAALVAAALAALALGGTSHLLVAALCAVLAGAGCPPLEGGLRSLWPAVLPDAAHVRTAYALDSSTQEIVYVAGPALAVAVATWLSPAWALALAAAAALVGSVVFATARPARAWRAVTAAQARWACCARPRCGCCCARWSSSAAPSVPSTSPRSPWPGGRTRRGWQAHCPPCSPRLDCSAACCSPASSPPPPPSHGICCWWPPCSRPDGSRCSPRSRPRPCSPQRCCRGPCSSLC